MSSLPAPAAWPAPPAPPYTTLRAAPLLPVWDPPRGRLDRARIWCPPLDGNDRADRAALALVTWLGDRISRANALAGADAHLRAARQLRDAGGRAGVRQLAQLARGWVRYARKLSPDAVVAARPGFRASA